MASIYEMNRDYTGIGSIVLTDGLYLETGLLNIAATSVDVTVGGITSLISVPSGLNYKVSNVRVELLGANTTGSLIASIGTNGSANNIVPATTFTGMNFIGQTWRIPTSGLVDTATSGTTISINITNPVTGSGAIINVFFTGEIV